MRESGALVAVSSLLHGIGFRALVLILMHVSHVSSIASVVSCTALDQDFCLASSCVSSLISSRLDRGHCDRDGARGC